MRTTLEMILDYMHEHELITEVDYEELFNELQELRYCKEHFYDEYGEENEALKRQEQYDKIVEECQKNKKVLEIIKEKNVDTSLLKHSENWLDYYTRFKHRTGKNTELTQEEFDLLKRWVDNE